LKREIKHAARLSREIRDWKETEHFDWGGGGQKGKRTTLQKSKNQNLFSARI